MTTELPPPNTKAQKSAPRDFLQAWILLLLRDWQAHGYALQTALAGAGFTGLDHSVLYRELRSLEEKGFLSSFWETGDSGPARRKYSVTEAGEKMLEAWAQDMRNYQQQVGRFLGDYFGAWSEFTGQSRGDGTPSSESKDTKGKDV